MSWNRLGGLILLATVATGGNASGAVGEVCPIREGQPLRFVDVFDGAPEELATLIPYQAKATSGYWRLAYIYEAGRFVTVRCKYNDNNATDVKLSEKVSRCDYRIDAKKVLKVSCK